MEVIPCFLNSGNRRSALALVWRSLAASGPHTMFLLDGAEQRTPGLVLRTVGRARHCRGFVITMHQGARLPLLHHCETSPALLDTLLDELHPGGDEALRSMALAACQRHHGNLRDVFFNLYDYHASRQKPQCAGALPAPPPGIR